MDEWRVGSSQCESSDRDRFLNVCIALHAPSTFFSLSPLVWRVCIFPYSLFFFLFLVNDFFIFSGSKSGGGEGNREHQLFLARQRGNNDRR